MEKLLEFQHLSKTFPGVKALEDINFTIMQGEVHVLVGENGAGKSTLIKILSGIYGPDPGSLIIWQGKQLTINDPIVAITNGIVPIYQDFSLFENLTVAENISIGLQVEKKKKTINWKKMYSAAEEVIKRVHLNIDLDEKVQNISVAKQQMVAIARALAYDVKLLIMDEPTSCLSKSEVDNLFNIINDLKSQGITILFVSHKMEEIFKIGDVITVLRDGKYKGTYPKGEITEKQLIKLMVGKEVTYTRYNKRVLSNTLVEVRNLSKKGNFKDISFKLNKGEILGVTGLVGAGRTEMIQALFGLNIPDSGEILIEGKKVNINSPVNAVNYGMGYIPENRQTEGVDLKKDMATNIVITILDELKQRLFISGKKKKKVANIWISKLNIRPPDPNILVSQLSGGNQQRVVIAKWLAIDPKILIVDEPTNGIDVKAKEEIHKILRDLSEKGISIIIVSSDMEEVIALCDRILVLKHGKMVAEIHGDTTQELILNKAIL